MGFLRIGFGDERDRGQEDFLRAAAKQMGIKYVEPWKVYDQEKYDELYMRLKGMTFEAFEKEYLKYISDINVYSVKTLRDEIDDAYDMALFEHIENRKSFLDGADKFPSVEKETVTEEVTKPTNYEGDWMKRMLKMFGRNNEHRDISKETKASTRKKPLSQPKEVARYHISDCEACQKAWIEYIMRLNYGCVENDWLNEGDDTKWRSDNFLYFTSDKERKKILLTIGCHNIRVDIGSNLAMQRCITLGEFFRKGIIVYKTRNGDWEEIKRKGTNLSMVGFENDSSIKPLLSRNVSWRIEGETFQEKAEGDPQERIEIYLDFDKDYIRTKPLWTKEEDELLMKAAAHPDKWEWDGKECRFIPVTEERQSPTIVIPGVSNYTEARIRYYELTGGLLD